MKETVSKTLQKTTSIPSWLGLPDEGKSIENSSNNCHISFMSNQQRITRQSMLMWRPWALQVATIRCFIPGCQQCCTMARGNCAAIRRRRLAYSALASRLGGASSSTCSSMASQRQKSKGIYSGDGPIGPLEALDSGQLSVAHVRLGAARHG